MINKNFLVIGLGKRVTTSILPALTTLTGCNLVGIHTRTPRTYSFRNKKFTTITNLDAIDFTKIDVIVVAINTENVSNFLAKLSFFNVKHITLFIDTPVLPPAKLWALIYFRFFKNVFVSEDYIEMINLKVFKKIVTSNILGKLKHIFLLKSGYRHHGIATIRHLASQKSILSIKNKITSHQNFSMDIKLPNQIEGTILGPRDYRVGKYLLVCEKGTISDFYIKNKNNFQIDYLFSKTKNYLGCKVTYKKKQAIIRTRYQIEQAPLIDSLKIESLAKIYDNGAKGKVKYLYGYLDAIYDRYAVLLSEKYGWFFDAKIYKSSRSFLYFFLLVFDWTMKLLRMPLVKIIRKFS